jgi:hypothetical protein
VEALDLAAGLGMVGAGMLVFDAQACELELQQHLAPARASGEDGGVVAEQGGRQVELLGGRMEAVDDIAGADGDEGSGGQEKPGMVVEEVEDLELAAIA